ncbi:MAG TPA: phosphatidate cytidylyltransferase [Opitutales bacterium]|nr:phosphatidate cytidylyltransferase [Opitutales bacterium]
MIKRALSTIGLWTIVLGTVYFFGANGGVMLLAGFTLLAQYEFNGLLEKSGLPPWKWATLAFGVALTVQAGLQLECGVYLWPIAAVALTLGALACAKNPQAHLRLAGSVLSLAYVPGMMMFYGKAASEHGLGIAIWIIATAKFTDVGGYLVGSAIGKNKLAPSISPGKTWEGVGGGLVLAALVAAVGAHFGSAHLPDWLTPVKAATLALPIGVAAILSDLSESAFKRRAGLKDSGKCIPGIGGALDLADSLLLASPVAYFLMK